MINAVEELYISNRPPQEAAQSLIDLTHGSNLGEAPSLSWQMTQASLTILAYMGVTNAARRGN